MSMPANTSPQVRAAVRHCAATASGSATGS